VVLRRRWRSLSARGVMGDVLDGPRRSRARDYSRWMDLSDSPYAAVHDGRDVQPGPAGRMRGWSSRQEDDGDGRGRAGEACGGKAPSSEPCRSPPP